MEEKRLRIALIKFNPDDKKAYMFEYPAKEYIEEGDTVLVENKDGNPQMVKVIDSLHFDFKYNTDEREFNRLVLVSGATLPLKKIIAAVEMLKYEEETKTDED